MAPPPSEPTSQSTTPLSEVGEFGLIDRLAAILPPAVHAGTVLGIGDDAAILAPTGDLAQVMTTDMLLEGVHFDLSYCPLPHLGYKALTASVSDVAAMNARPSQAVVSLGLSSRFPLEAVEELYQGLAAACRDYGIDLVGGDTSTSRAGLFISVTLLGQAPADRIVRRSGAAPGQVICVTGDLGAAYLGLQILEREKQVFLANPAMQPDLEEYEYVVGRQLRPEARIQVIYELAELGVRPTAMIDVSDGLASELLHISRASGVGILIYEQALPIEDQTKLVASELGLQPLTCALNGGEDYELLFTLTEEDYEKVRHTSLPITAIGITRDAAEGAQVVATGGGVLPLQAQGWQAFAQRPS